MFNKKNRFKIQLILLLLFAMNFVHASLHKSLWSRWAVNNPLSTETISHQLWQEFLDHHVFTNEEHINLVDYDNLNQNDLNLLRNYIHSLSEINIDNYNRQEQLAYWINLYNALTVQTVAMYYPLTTVQDINISPGLFSVGPWGANLFKINDISLTLDEINNRIIRPIWNDPRTHYALSNATIGAPNLSKKAYKAATLENQLNEAALTYVNSLRGVQVIEGKLIISKLYEWYEDDFGGTKQDITNHLLRFANEPLSSQLKHINTVDSYVYNWHLNCPAHSKL